jgi:hypothetical protein
LRFSRIICGEVGFRSSGPLPAAPSGDLVDQLVVLVDAEHAVRREALDGERPGDADLLRVVVRLVVEVLELGLGGDRGVDLLLARDALLPPTACSLPRLRRPLRDRPRGDLPLLPGSSLSGLFSCSRSGSRASWNFSQITSISALLAIDLSVMCGTRS